MAKLSYKVPTSLNRSYLEQEITLTGGGFNAPPTSLKSILFYIGCICVGLWAMMNTFIKDAPFWLKGLFLVWVIIFTIFFGRTSKTKELKITQLMPLVQYAPKQARNVLTRSTSEASPFYSIVGIRQIAEDGTMQFLDGRVGRAYLVVGSASILLFDEDRKAILDRVDSFWRKVSPGTEFAFMTTKEPQRIYKQVAHLERTNRALEMRDPELLDLMDERYDILKDYVGSQFKSIHQYLVVMADNMEQLRQAHNVVAAEVEGSSYMIKACTQLNDDDVVEMLSVLYQGRR